MSYLQRINRLRAALTAITTSDEGRHAMAAIAGAALSVDDVVDSRSAPATFKDLVLALAREFEAAPGSPTPTIRGADDILAFARQIDDVVTERTRSLDTAEFAASVLITAAHQRARLAGATLPPHEHWLRTVCYQVAKVLRAASNGDREKAMLNCIKAAAVLANWHAAIAGTGPAAGAEAPHVAVASEQTA